MWFLADTYLKHIYWRVLCGSYCSVNGGLQFFFRECSSYSYMLLVEGQNEFEGTSNSNDPVVLLISQQQRTLYPPSSTLPIKWSLSLMCFLVESGKAISFCLFFFYYPPPIPYFYLYFCIYVSYLYHYLSYFRSLGDYFSELGIDGAFILESLVIPWITDLVDVACHDAIGYAKGTR